MLEAELQLTVVTNPIRVVAPHTTFMADPNRYLELDIAAVKPAILYGDVVSLRSYLIDVVVMATHYDQYYQMPLHHYFIPVSLLGTSKVATLREYGIDTDAAPREEAARFLAKWQNLAPDEAFDALEDFWSKHSESLDEVGRRLFEAAHRFHESIDMRPLEKASKAGLLNVTGWSAEAPGMFEPEQDYVDRASGLVYDMIDARHNLVMDAGALATLGEGPAAASELELAARMLKPLPMFPKASIDELLDIRKELAGPLRVFRVEVAGLARKLPEEGIDDKFMNDLVRTRIRPALDEIDELTAENRYLRQLADKSMEAKTMLPASATFALGLAGLSGIAQICAAAAGVAAVPLEALRARQRNNKDLRRKQFYFLWSLYRRS